MRQNNFLNKYFLSNNIKSIRIIQHVVFWIIYIISTGIIYTQTSVQWVYSILLDIISIITVYINFLVLIPRYFFKQYLVKYILYLLLTLVVFTIVRTILYKFTWKFFGFRFFEDAHFDVLNQFLTDFTYLVAIVLFTTLIKMTRIWYWDQTKLKELERDNLTAELNFLKSQINPHFLFNILNSIYVLNQTNSPEAGNIILKLSDMLRYQLYDCSMDKTLLSEEIEYIRNYLDIQHMRHNRKLKLDFIQKGEPDDLVIAPFILIPFIENAFKHGAEKSLGDAYIRIVLEIEDNEIVFSVINSKQVSPRKTVLPLKKSGGIGLQNVMRRLDLIYPDRYKLKIQDNENEYNLILHLKNEHYEPNPMHNSR